MSQQLTYIPAHDGERMIPWPRIAKFSMTSDGKDPQVVVIYRHGGKQFLHPEQAAYLWQKNEKHAGCECPCFFRRECDTAPDTCRACQLAEILAGLDDDPRPSRRVIVQPFDGRNVALVMLLFLVLLLTAALANHSPTEAGSPPIAGTGTNARDMGR